MENEVLSLHPTEIPLWDEYDLDNAQLGRAPEQADPEQVREILDNVAFRLPLVLVPQSLEEAPSQETPLQVRLEGPSGYAYHLLSVPLTILLPTDLRLARLGMTLTFKNGGESSVVAHALAPTSQTITESHEYGRVSLDVSKALQFIFPPAAECLGLQLAFPLRWESEYPLVQASGPNSNPVAWRVEDEAVREGFIGYVITRSSLSTPFRVEAEIAAELHRKFLGRLRRARLASDKREYMVGDQ